MILAMSLSSTLVFAVSFCCASFVVFLIEERVAKIKHLHFVSGVHPVTYWVSAFIWDFLMYCIFAIVCFLLFIYFDVKAFVTPENITSLISLLVLYG